MIFPCLKQFNNPRLLFYYSKLLKSTVAAPLENKQNLPRLPVPKLYDTLDKFLRSAQPFLSPGELGATKVLLDNFVAKDGIGWKLQKLLEERAENTENWLADWWLDYAYMEFREPVVLFTSPGQVFPLQDFRTEGQRLEYTADLVLAALDYKALIDSGKMPLDKMGEDTLDMNQYSKIFGTCRIPGLPKDTLQFNPQSRHIVIARNNNFFKLRLTNSKGESPSRNELVSILQEIVKKSEKQASSVGILTAQNRDKWAEIHQYLIKDPVNRKCIEDIQKALFLVCLDNPMPGINGNSRTVASHQLIHGGGSRGNTANRWFDKTVQFVVGTDGIVGLTYEHSPSEGQPIAVMTDYLVDYIKNGTSKCLPDTKFQWEPEKLDLQIDETIEKCIRQASLEVDKLQSNLDLESFQFDQYGKNFIKLQKLSPDSFLQMAMQLAFYRLHNVPGAHYESAATRKYIHGRTETIRSCSIESVHFARTFLDPQKSDGEKYASLKRAVSAHKKYTVAAVNGFGVDRHLLGLKLVALENNVEIPELFKDPAFVRSCHWRVSTSQVATKCDGFMCYGPAVNDGYGCCYNPRENDINFGVSAFVDCGETSARQFRQALELSLSDMFEVAAKNQKSKL